MVNKIVLETSKDVRHRTLAAQFGDGNGQYAGKGANRKVRSYNVTWAPLTLDEKDTVEAALDTVEGFGILLYTPCNEVTQLKYRLVDGAYSTEPVSPTMYKISCKIEQRYF